MGAVSFDMNIQVKEGRKSYQIETNAFQNEKVSFEELAQFCRQALIQISTEALAEEQQKGFDKKPVLVVDNKFNVPKEAVSPFGKIEYFARQSLKEIALFIYDSISSRSIKGSTGTYKKYNIVTLNGKVIALNRKELEDYFNANPVSNQADKLRFINATPYARKLERYSKYSGKSGPGVKWKVSTDKQKRSGVMRQHKGKGGEIKESMMVLAENGTYYLSAKAAKAKYKGNSYIVYESLPGNYLGIENIPIKAGKKTLRRTYKKSGAPYLYPTILVYVQSSGIDNGVRQ